jgi:hypothetical protein
MVKLLTLPSLKKLASNKRSSLFRLLMSNKEKKVLRLTPGLPWLDFECRWTWLEGANTQPERF